MLPIFYPDLQGDKSDKPPMFKDVQSRSLRALYRFISSKYPIADFFVSPGHAWLQQEDNTKMESNIEPILINASVSRSKLGQWRLDRVDVWDGHHRLLARLQAYGRNVTLEKCPSGLNHKPDSCRREKDVLILINRRTSSKEKYEQWVKLSGLLLHYRFVQSFARVSGFMAEPHSVKWAPGAPRPEYECRLGETHFFPAFADIPRLGLFFGSFDPVHNGHLDIIKYLLEENILEIIVLIPNAEAMNKTFQASQLHRIAMLRLAIKHLLQKYPKRIFIFLRNSQWIGSMQLRIPLVEGMAQFFGIRVEQIYHIEGLEANKPFLGQFPAIVLPRASGIQSEHLKAQLHPKSRLDQFFFDRWNLSSSALRRWLQVYRLPHPRARNSDVEGIVIAALPQHVKKYIEKHHLYLSEVPFFRLKPKLPSAAGNSELKDHGESETSTLIKGYLITTGVPERVQAFRRQAVHVHLPISEHFVFCGADIDVVPNSGRLLILHSGSYLSPSRGFLVRSAAPDLFSISIGRKIPYPLTNFELACYLSHYHIWALAFWRGNRHVLIMEDRTIFLPKFSTSIMELSVELESRDYSLCYLYSREPTPDLRVAHKDDLLLTAYLVSRNGLQVLLENAFPISRPVDWYVKDTLCNRLGPTTVFAKTVVQRNEELITTIPKLSHSW
jgi:cytidyltransferase-like protein